MMLKLEYNENEWIREMIGLPKKSGVYCIPYRTTFSKFIEIVGKRGFREIFLHLVLESVNEGVICRIMMAADLTLFFAWCNLRKKREEFQEMVLERRNSELLS